MTDGLRRPESVLVVVFTRAAEVLLLRRRQPQFWQSVTGSLEVGESVCCAARRELAEETGIAGVELVNCRASNRFEISAAWRHKFAADVRYNTEHIFTCELPQRVPVVLSIDEHSEYRWVTLCVARNMLWSWTNLDALDRYVAPGLDC